MLWVIFVKHGSFAKIIHSLSPRHGSVIHIRKKKRLLLASKYDSISIQFEKSDKLPENVRYDLLETNTYRRLLSQPHLLREELIATQSEHLKSPVIIDEVQRIPILLDEVHWLIENKKIGFILCGSSARKLKRGAANLLGGRAWRFTFYPLVFQEIPKFDLKKALNQGLLPTHFLSQDIKRDLRAYVDLYLKEEIQSEGLVRNLPGFARFLDSIGFSHGQMINYHNIARDCGIDAKTVKEYYQILIDTLIGYYIYPFTKRAKRQLITTTPKFYLFDVGIANYLTHKKISTLKGILAGSAFEHFIFMELTAFLGIHEIDSPIYYWRSKNGLEVDFVLMEGDIAIEVKISENPHLTDFKGLTNFCQDYLPKEALVVCQTPRSRKIITKEGHSITIIHWKTFLKNLWDRIYC